jgi:hypothetical protein
MLATFNAVLPSVPADTAVPVLAANVPAETATGVTPPPFGEVLAEATEPAAPVPTPAPVPPPDAEPAEAAPSDHAPADLSLGRRLAKPAPSRREVAPPIASLPSDPPAAEPSAPQEANDGETPVDSRDVSRPAPESSRDESLAPPPPLPMARQEKPPVTFDLAPGAPRSAFSDTEIETAPPARAREEQPSADAVRPAPASGSSTRVLSAPAIPAAGEPAPAAVATTPVPAGKIPVPEAPAQIAAPAFSFAAATPASLGYKIKNTIQTIDKEFEAKAEAMDGIVPANTGATMTPGSTPFAPPALTPVTAVAAVPAPAATPAADTTKAAEAVRLLERVAEAADHLAAHPAERVTVRIDLADTSHVEIRVALRGGRLQADFRTDSAEMRQALSQAWPAFTAARAENPVSWADPVFAALPAPAPTVVQAASAAQDNAGGFSFDADRGSRHRQNARPEAGAGLPAARSFAGVDHAGPAAPAALPGRHETSRHLSLFA